MKMIIHDLEKQEFDKYFSHIENTIKIISTQQPIHKCVGCFACWIKTPGACVIRDPFGDMGEWISKSEEVIIISKCCYGGYSPFIKNVLDRSISYILPYFVIRGGEMHHRSRYNNRINLNVWFYGADITPDEKMTAEKMVIANGVNLNVKNTAVRFFSNIMEMEGNTL